MNKTLLPLTGPISPRILSLVLLLAFLAWPIAGLALVYPPNYRFIRVPAPLAGWLVAQASRLCEVDAGKTSATDFS